MNPWKWLNPLWWLLLALVTFAGALCFALFLTLTPCSVTMAKARNPETPLRTALAEHWEFLMDIILGIPRDVWEGNV